MNPEAIVVATGCYVQTGGDNLEKADIVVWKITRRSILWRHWHEYQRKINRAMVHHVIKINQTKEYEDLSIDHTAEHVRAYIKVQDGCNQFCTYCIIPLCKRPCQKPNIEQCAEEVRTLAEKGYKEVVYRNPFKLLCGVDFPEEKKETLLSLIRAVHEIEGIKRIRLDLWSRGIVTEEFARRDRSASEDVSAFPSFIAERL